MIKALPDLEDEAQAKQYLTYLLSRKEYARSQLFNKLQQRNYPKDAANQLLDELAELSWQSDERYATSLIRAKAQSGYGPKYIQQLFFQHQVAVSFNDIICELEINWVEHLVRVIEKKYATKDLTDYKQKQKCLRYCYSRGYSSSDIQLALEIISEGY
ncbi:recombination regulator RecX [Catenovulum agarivorans DS-2]|uniref:Regulatory protein RecX n=1 Tax=Catenovulum agarivorans DS-2 TaxID=1328313 RepID=W7QQM9_9ALTE|nr:regulatory protein RecX [Catenovulum agarivorans]EWH11297.1 recombination regulator RecX [Catenovulum agarivorans DS-2]